MPAQALLGLGWLANVLGGIFVVIVNFFGRVLTKRIALTVAAVAAFATLSAGIVATLEGLVSGVVTAFPVAANMGLMMPDDFTSTLGIYFAGRIAYWVYAVNWQIIQMRLNV